MLIHDRTPLPWELPKLASQIKVTEYKSGDRFRIVDPDDKHAGRSGVLEFVGGQPYLLIANTYHPVKLERCIALPRLEVVRD